MAKKTISKKDHYELAVKVNSEGFGYYLTQYGPDLKLISKLGFDLKELEKAVTLISEVEDRIMEGFELEEDF